MAMTLTTPNTILGTLLPKGETARLVANIVTVILGTLILTISAKIQVPTWPVPVTLQTLAIAGLAAAFGARIGVATVLLYILEGMSGLPVFAGATAGPAYILGPTGGFIVGWLPMAYIIGRVADRGASGNFLKLFSAMVVGDAIVFVLGFAWLAIAATFVTNVGWLDQANLLGSAFQKAIQPFIVWDLLKLALAALTVAGGWQLVKGRKA
jgi:biotin transport system substrate-specific component